MPTDPKRMRPPQATNAIVALRTPAPLGWAIISIGNKHAVEGHWIVQ